jgi:DNA repair exonuclease SbcCD nuclease subunit
MQSETRRFKFLQVSDVHLDAHLSASRLPLPLAQRQERMREVLETFLLSLEVAKQEKVHAVFIPGNLWDNESVTGATAAKVIKGCEDLGEIPVLITPGNKDFYHPESFYNQKTLRSRGLPLWSPNVMIFSTAEFAAVSPPSLPGVSFTGRACIADPEASYRVLQRPVPRNERALLNILMFHGALESLVGDEGALSGPVFSDEELEIHRFDYAAIGQHIDFSEIQSSHNQVVGAYAGCLAGNGFDVVGSRYAILGSIESIAADQWQCHLDAIELDKRRFVMVGADISGLATDDIIEEIAVNIEELGGRADRDLLYIHLEGSYKLDSDASSLIEQLKERYLHLVVIDNTRPDYLSAHLDHRTTEWKYIESLLEMKRNTEMVRSGEFDTTALESGAVPRNVVEDALYYGLDALRHKKVTIRDVD